MAPGNTSSLPTIVGLGNPGQRYANSRHNVGFRCVDLLAQRHHITMSERRKHTVLGHGTVGERQVVLAKPRTFMNASGIAVEYLVQRFGTRPPQLLVIIDDLDLPLGTLRLRASGGSGGHNGLSSIMEELGSQDFSRLRVGIGRPPGGAIGHVLGTFAADEEKLLAEVLDRVAQVVETWVEEGVNAAMNRFN